MKQIDVLHIRNILLYVWTLALNKFSGLHTKCVVKARTGNPNLTFSCMAGDTFDVENIGRTEKAILLSTLAVSELSFYVFHNFVFRNDDSCEVKISEMTISL